MKILIITNLYPPHYVGGYELHCRVVVENLRQRGHQVHVLTSDYRAGTRPAREDSQVSRVLKIHGMFGNSWLPIWNLQALERHNNRILRETLNRLQPDLVYGWSFSGLSKSMLFTMQNTRVPTVFAVCDHWVARAAKSDVWLNWWNREGDAKLRLARLFLKLSGCRALLQRFAPTNPVQELRFQRPYFCSRFLRDFTAAAGFKVQQGAVIYCPLNTANFCGTPKPQQVPLRHLLYVGRLHPDKGIMTALRAMACLRRRFDGELSIYGRGDPDYEMELRQFAESNRLNVVFKHVENPVYMPEVYAAHDALIFPSEWGEPFALTPLEAMSMGLPVVGTTTGGSAELLRHGKNSLTFAAGDSFELACRILELDKDPALRVRLAVEGQREVRERCDEPIILDQIEAYLEESVKTWKTAGVQ